MGHREDLLEGAKRCLYEKGYARTTARDLVAASGTNLASIGYHFGSKEALLNEALIAAIGELGDRMGPALAAPDLPDDPLARFAALFQLFIDDFERNKQFWIANFEVMAQVERSPEVKASLRAAVPEGRAGLAALLLGLDEDPGPQTSRTLGSLLQALVTGLIAQWLIDPDAAPSGQDLANGLQLATGAPRTD